MDIECKSIEDGIMKFAELLALDIQSQSKQNLVDSGTIDNGELLKSSDGTMRTSENQVSFSFLAPYADFIEYGTDPHYPPYTPIFQWCMRKLGLSEKEANQRAHQIINKIGKYGTEPNPFVRNAIDIVVSKYK